MILKRITSMMLAIILVLGSMLPVMAEEANPELYDSETITENMETDDSEEMTEEESIENDSTMGMESETTEESSVIVVEPEADEESSVEIIEEAEEESESVETVEEPTHEEEPGLESVQVAEGTNDSNMLAQIEPYYSYCFSSKSVTMNDISYTNALVFDPYNSRTGEACFFLDSHYTSMSFIAAQTKDQNRTMSIYCDGVEVWSKTFTTANVSEYRTINLSGVRVLKIVVKGSSSSFPTFLGNVSLTNNNYTPEDHKKPIPSTFIRDVIKPTNIPNRARYFVKSVEMGDQVYENAICIDSYNSIDTSVIYNINGWYQGLDFIVGNSDNTYSSQKRSVKVIVDGNVAYEKVIEVDAAPESVHIDVTGAQQLEFAIGGSSSSYSIVFGGMKLTSDGTVRDIRFWTESDTTLDGKLDSIPIVSVTDSKRVAELDPYVRPTDAANQGYKLSVDNNDVADVTRGIKIITNDEGQRERVYYPATRGKSKGNAVITATSDEGSFTGTCNVNSTVSYRMYQPDIDGWGFPNDNSMVTGHNADAVDTMLYGYGDIWEVNRRWASYKASETTGSGICYSLAITSLAAYLGYPSISSWGKQGVTTASGMELADRDLQNTMVNNYYRGDGIRLSDYVHAGFEYQFARTKKTDEELNSQTATTLEEIINAVGKFQKGQGEDVIVNISGWYKAGKKTKRGRHSLVAYKVETSGSIAKVYVYDCNTPGRTDRYLEFSKDSSGKWKNWSYQIFESSQTVWGSEQWFSSIDYEYGSAADFGNIIMNNNGAGLIPITMITVLEPKNYIVTDLNWKAAQGTQTMGCTDGYYTGTSSEELSPLPIYGATENDSQSSYTMAAYADGVTVSVAGTDDNAKGSFEFIGKESSITVYCDGKASMDVCTSDGTNQVKITDDKGKSVSFVIENADGETYKVTGTKASGKKPGVNYTEDSDVLEISGYDTVTIEATEDGKTTTKTVTTDNGSCKVTAEQLQSVPAKITSVKTSIESTGIKIQWGRNSSASGYEVYRSTDGKSYSKVKTITSNKTITWTDAKATTNGKYYYYKVRAYKKSDSGTVKGVFSSAQKYFLMKKPAIASLKSPARGTISVGWKRNTAASGYQIRYSTSSKMTKAKTVTITKNTIVSKKITKLLAKKRYYVQIRTYKKVGTAKYYSTWSAKKYVTTKA